MTTYKILYWQEVPSQIKAEDESDEVTLPMPPQFMERIDQLAAQRGLQDSDDYLAQWRWSDEEQREGPAQEVAETVRAELAEVGQVGNLRPSGTRPNAGS